jgi:hypothetical protein
MFVQVLVQLYTLLMCLSLVYSQQCLYNIQCALVSYSQPNAKNGRIKVDVRYST